MNKLRWASARGSVRLRTTAVAITVVGSALVLGASLIVHALERSLDAGVVESARLRAQAVANLAAGGNLPPVLVSPGDDSAFIQVIDGAGRVISATENVAGQEPLTPPIRRGTKSTIGGDGTGSRNDSAESSTTSMISLTSAIPVGQGGRYLVVKRSVTVSNGSLTVVAGVSLQASDTTVHRVTDELLIAIPLIVLLVGATAWLLAGRALLPVESIRRRVEHISDRDLDQRVPHPGGRDEISRLAHTMNGMLKRLEEASELQRRFVSDSSHELRSPVASAIAQLDVDLAHPESADWPETVRGVRAELDRLADLISDLLLLARADEHRLARERSPVDLDELVSTEVVRAQMSTGIAIDASTVEPVQVDAVPGELARAVTNLLSNAVRHARKHVAVDVRKEQDMAIITVSDDGAGIPLADREHVFERFVRLDDSRTRGGGGSGLGLSIVREIVIAHGGSISIDDNSPGTSFRVRLPLLRDTASRSS